MNFGAQLRDQWLLDPAITYLNHSTVGATPRRVLEAQRAIQDEIERQPSRFLLRELSAIVVGQPRAEVPRIRVAAGAVARFVGAREADLVFVDNATTGANAVLRSYPWQPGDEVLVSDLGYGGITRAAAFATRERGASVRTVQLVPPFTSVSIAGAFEAAVGPRTRMAIVDHITAESAIVLPIEEIASRLKRHGVDVLADGAHAPGAIPLDVPALGVDWYVANLHKWALVPRSSGLLWAAPERQGGLHPAVISWGSIRGSRPNSTRSARATPLLTSRRRRLSRFWSRSAEWTPRSATCTSSCGQARRCCPRAGARSSIRQSRSSG